jgi:hypothetical protein
MNMDNLDQGTLGPGAAELGGPPRRGWWSRNWLWFVPTVLLGMILLCCGCPLGIGLWFYSRVFDLDVFQDAMKKIEVNADLTSELGEPIKPAYWPPPVFQPLDRELDVRWDVQGPKGRANAHIKARLMEGRWEPVVVEVTLANGKKVPIAVEGGNEAQPFEAPKADGKKPDESAPPPDINLPVPPGDMPEKT